MKKLIVTVALSIVGILCTYAQSPSSKDSLSTNPSTPSTPSATSSAATTASVEKKKNWYEVIKFGGYAHFRYNRLLETNPDLKCDECDKSIGDGGGFFVRRARLKFSGQVHERLFIYIQADFATAASSGSSVGLNFLQIRDMYGDIYLTKDKVHRIRPGISKVPFGFDNIQSSQNRIAIDRTDALNSAMYNERDIGVFYYYTPKKIQERFKFLSDAGLKGSGDYGIFGIGVFNGQTASRNELNNNMHIVARVTYPFLVGEKQIIETSLQAYTGQFNVGEAKATGTSTATNPGGLNYLDQRVAASFIMYPQPFGIQAEYMFGTSPTFKYNGPTATVQNEIVSGRNEGGYVQLMYLQKVKNMVFIPYIRGQYFYGGKKIELDARRHVVKEIEFGVEYQIIKQLELTLAYNMADRIFEDSKKPDNHQIGNFMRIQIQFNY